MKLNKIDSAAGPRAQIVQAGEFRMARCDLDEAAALFLRPFAIHQVVDRFRPRAPRAPQQPSGNRETEQRVRPGDAGIAIEHQRHDHRKIEQQVRLVVHMIRVDCDRAGPCEHIALEGEQREGCEDCDYADRDSLFRGRDPLAVDQRLAGAHGDPCSGHRDQHHLEDRCQRFRLAVAEAVRRVRRPRGDHHAEQGDQARHQIERAVRQAAEQRHRTGLPHRPELERDQKHRGRNRCDGGGAAEVCPLAGRPAPHGNSSVLVQPSPSRRNTQRSCRRLSRSSQNSIRSACRVNPVQWAGRSTSPPAKRASAS